jgi:hypothetical protein
MSEHANARRAVLLAGIPLPGRRSRPVELVPAALDELIAWATQERLTGLLHRAWLAGDLTIGPDAAEHDVERLSSALDEAAVTGARSSLTAEATGVAAVGALREFGIEGRLFKGVATSHLDYQDPAERTFFDADVIVRRRDLGPSVDVLDRAGFRRGRAVMRPAWERRFARAVELRNDAGVELDLHAALATGYFGMVLDHDVVWADSVPLRLGGLDCPTFGATSRLLISCYAIVLSRGPRCRLVADLARQLLVSGADWEAAVEWAGDGDCVVGEALRQLGDVLGAEHAAVEWARRSTVPSPMARRALQHARAAESKGWSEDARSTILALGAVDRARFAAGIVERRLRGR